MACEPLTLTTAARLLAGAAQDRRRLPPARHPAGDFPVAVRGLVAASFAGANVTIPHKVAAFDICDEVDETARRAGAVNTLVFKDGRIAGSNTGWLGVPGQSPRSWGRSGRRSCPAVGCRWLELRAIAAVLQDAGSRSRLPIGPAPAPNSLPAICQACTSWPGARVPAPCPTTRCW